MSETHESGCFPCGWLKKRDRNKADTVNRSLSSKQAQGSSVEKLGTAESIERSIPVQATKATIVYPSNTSDEAKPSKDNGLPASKEYTSRTAKQAPPVPNASTLSLEKAGTTRQSITISTTNASATDVRGQSEEANSKDVPSDMEYAMEATKKALTVLKGIADLARFPLVKEVVELGISILDTCQTISEVQSGAHRLRSRITCLLLSVADSTKEAEESERLMKDLENLKMCLATIMRRLQSIANQNTFKASYLSEPNMKIISECEKDFQDSMERFEILRSLEMGQAINVVQRQLATFSGVSQGMASNVELIKHEVDDIKSILKSMKTSDAKSTTIRVPRVNSHLFGRKEVIQRIAEDLSSLDPKRSRVCILAPGGMGKTSTALAVMHHNLTKETFGEDRYWVPCIQANSIDNFIAILARHIKAENRTGDRLDDIIATLQDGDRRRVILLDNFETPWRGIHDSERELTPILEELDSIPHISILVTMRSEFPPLDTWREEVLEPIQSADSMSLYTSIHPDARKYPDQLKELLDQLGHMPYAITLMASRGKRSSANPAKLLKEWRAQGTDMLSRSSEGINRCIELSMQSSYVQDCEDAMRILQILSLLPAGVDSESLSIWAGEWSSQAIETLRNAALIITRYPSARKDGAVDHYFVLPVIQSYMAKKNRIPLEVREAVLEACYRFLAQCNATFIGPNDNRFSTHLAAIASQEANLQALLTDALSEQHPMSATPLSPSNHLDDLLPYISYQKWARPRTEIAQQVIALAQRAAAPRQEAATLFCLGDMLRRMAKYKDAREAYEYAYAIFDSVQDDLMTLRSQLLLIEVDVFQGVPPPKVWVLFDSTRERWQTALAVNPTFDTYVLYYRGFLLWYEQKDEEAIPVLNEAAERCGMLGLLYQQAESLYYLARSYAHLNKFGDALQTIDAAIRLYVGVFAEGFKTPDLVSALLMRARCLKGLERWDDEMEPTLMAALDASRELGLSTGVPQILYEQGEVYMRKGDLSAARNIYEEAIKDGAGIDDGTSGNAVEGAKHNLRHIEYLYAKAQGSESAEDVPFSRPERY